MQFCVCSIRQVMDSRVVAKFWMGKELMNWKGNWVANSVDCRLTHAKDKHGCKRIEKEKEKRAEETGARASGQKDEWIKRIHMSSGVAAVFKQGPV